MPADDPGSNRGRGEISPEEREAIRQRSLEIGKKLDSVQARDRVIAERSKASGRSQVKDQSYGQAFRLTADLLAGVGVGAFVGWLLVREFGAATWVLVVCAVLGFAAGLLNVFRTARQIQAKAEADQLRSPSIADDKDDDD